MNYFPTVDHAMYQQLLGLMSFTLNLKNKQLNSLKVAGIYIKNIVFKKKSVKIDVLERVPMSFCQQKVLLFALKRFSYIAFQ